MTEYSGTGFQHTIPYSNYANMSREEILNKYDDSAYIAEQTGVCVKVIDGDTIDFKENLNNDDEPIRVRFVGVNTPEKKDIGYSASKKFVEKMILDKTISLNIDSQKPKDDYDRTLAVVLVEGKNLNEILLNEGLAEVMYIPPSEFNPNGWVDDTIIEPTAPSNPKTDTIKLPSTIINQKKKLFFYVEQSQDLVWPKSKYDYHIYVKNISGQIIENLKIYIANPEEVMINEKNERRNTYEIPTLKPGQSVLINVNDCRIVKEGYYYVNFIAMANESEIKTQTLLIKCGYENDNKKTLHRIAFYNFSPYEDAYMQRVSDFSETVTQLTKIQTKPFGTKTLDDFKNIQYFEKENQEMVRKYQNGAIKFEQYQEWFRNIKQQYRQVFETNNLELDLYAQDIFLTNTDDISSMYLGRENWESNIEESYTGETLAELIKYINRESDLVDIDFLRVGSNEMENDFQRIFPNGFIHRFGLMKSEFYKLLGIIPKIYSINDDLFRWARSEDEPIIYPIRENDKWNTKPWSGTGYYVYKCIEQEDETVINIEEAIFSTKEDAQEYVSRQDFFNKTHFIENITYLIRRRDWLPGIFYVEIPLSDIPANFLLPDIDQIQAIIELSKPYGLKGYPRFNLKNDFQHKTHFSYLPTVTPHMEINFGEYNPMNYYIEQKKYMNTDNGVKLSNYGNQFIYINQYFGQPSIYNHYPRVNVCYTLDINIKYFVDKGKIYIHLYNSQDNIKTDVDVIEVSANDLLNILSSNNIPIDGAYMNYGTSSQKKYNGKQVFNNNTLKNTICGNKNVFVVVNKVDNALMLDSAVKTDKEDNPIYSQYHDINYNIACNNGKKTFDGCIQDDEEYNPSDNHLNQILAKNSEDVFFYLADNGGFTENTTIHTEKLSAESDISARTIYPKSMNQNDYGPIAISSRYKTLNYFDDKTGKDYVINANRYKTLMVSKDSSPINSSVNILFRNVNDTKSYIISYQRLYDDIYKISYKTYKNKEVVVKEIITRFSQLLFSILEYDSSKELIKVFYKQDNKLYLFTAFTTKIINNDNKYNLRISITSDIALENGFELNLELIQAGIFVYGTDWYLTNKEYSTLLSTDFYQPSEIITSDINWENLYKINKDDNTFATFKNTNTEKTKVNGIRLYIDDINIPQNSVVDKIYLDVYSHVVDNISLRTQYHTNANLYNQNEKIAGTFKIDNYQIYDEHNLKYLYNQLAIAINKENAANIEEQKSLIDTHNKINKNIDIEFSKETPMIIKNKYWNEVSFEESTKGLKTSEFKNVYLILEGYNHGNNVRVHSQLAYYDGVGNENTDTVINSGYFYKKIPIPYNATYNIELLNIRFRFENIEEIDLYNVKAEIYFNQPQTQNANFLMDGGDIRLQGIKKQVCDIAENLDGDDVRNGLVINMNFDDIQNYIKIYSVVVNVVYHEKAFTNVFEVSENFDTISATSVDGTMRGCVFDEQVSDMRQDIYTTKKSNGEYDAGFEIDNRIYQAFKATNDNITSIELKPNGKVGSPDSHLKIAILDNYDNLPNNVLKEIIIDVAQSKIFDKEAYKYNIYVDNLVVGNTYWFSIEPLDKTKDGARRFFYSNHQVGEYKLLSTHDGDVINQHASLYFRLYTKANNYSFKKLPFVFEPKVYNFETELTEAQVLHEKSDRDVNYITEIQMYDGEIKNLTESLFSNDDCLKE